MKEYAREFYTSAAWRSCSKSYMQSQNYICERCGGVAEICHHKTHLTPENINDPAIALSWSNLEALCMDCHNREHMARQSKVFFSESGDVQKVREGRDILEFCEAAAALSEVLKKMPSEASTGREKDI